MGLFDNVAKLTGSTSSDSIGQAIEEMVEHAVTRRKPHERRWFDNNFFDEGYHFRVVSRKTGRVIDHASKQSGYVERAIPRASKQIRGTTNLLFAAEPYPVVFPKRISQSQFATPEEHQKAVEEAKTMARKQGIWLSNNWKEEQHLDIKLIDKILKAAKNSIAYTMVYTDDRTKKLVTDVYDAFDLILYGHYDDLQKVPFITKTCPMDIEEAKTNPIFDPAMTANLTPDNKYATSEIKDAYMRSRYGARVNAENSSSIIIKETFIKEYLSDSNWENAVKKGQDNGAMEGKSKGDQIMRHVFSGGGITLRDEYVNYDKYPFADFRFEPGPLYQTPYIERFIPQNKSVDIIMTRLEKWVNSMVVGVYQQRKGENMQVSNFPGGQKIEYETTPLTQMNVASPGATPFNVISMFDKYIEEQGQSTSSLSQIPSGVKAGVAIENLKQSEYAQLKIPTLMLKKCITDISELMLERAHKEMLEPVEISSIEDGEPMYFDAIGEQGAKLYEKINQKLPEGTVVLSKNTKVRIEIEAGLGLTMEGKKAAMKELITDFITLYEKGFIGAEAMAMMIKRYTETYGYGSTEELMEAIENGITQGQMSEQQIKQVQLAVLQALKDADVAGPGADKKQLMISKIGTLESMKDAGLIDKDNGKGAAEAGQKFKDTLTKIYDDAPPDIRRQIEMALGMQPSQEEDISPKQADTLAKVKGVEQADRQIDQQGAIEGEKLSQAERVNQEKVNLEHRKVDESSKQGQTKAELEAQKIKAASQRPQSTAK